MADDEVQADAVQAETKPAPDRDFYLQLVVSLVQRYEGVSIPITLATNGMLVSGYILSSYKFFEKSSKTLATALFLEEGSEARTNFEADIAGLPGKPEEDVDLKTETLNYIHLDDVKFFTPAGESMNVTGDLIWRGRISEVSGWSLGAFSKT